MVMTCKLVNNDIVTVMGINFNRLAANILRAPGVFAHGYLCGCHKRLISRTLNPGPDHVAALGLLVRGIIIRY